MTSFIVGFLLSLGFGATLIPEGGIPALVILGFDGLWALFHLIAACLLIKWVRFFPACGAIVFFGFASMIVHIIDGLLILMKLRGRIAQPDGAQQSAWTTEAPMPKY